MKKTSFVAMAVMLAAICLSGASITLVQPSGGELCLGQDNYPIQWSAVGVSGNIKLVLFRNNSKIGRIAADLPVGSSPYLWKAGQYEGGMAVAGEGYKILVSTMDNEIDDFGDPFALKTGSPPCQSPPPPPPPPQAALQLEKPNGGESFVLHHDCTIAWKSIVPTPVGKVRLQLMREGCCTIGILAENLPATGTFAWKAGEYPGNTAPAGKYRIRVSSMADPKIYDESDAAFDLKSLTALAPKIQKMKVLKGETVPGVYQNFPCNDTFPGKFSPPVALSVFQQGWQQMFGPGCGIVNSTAMVGAFWFPYYQYQAASLYRSRILFYLSKYVDKAGALKSAKLKMKRVHSVHEDASSGCGCSENLWVLEAPMTSSKIPAIGQRIDVSLGTAEFTRDVTEIVRQWLNGSLANNGLLLLAGELPCSGGRKCASCYEASLILDFE